MVVVAILGRSQFAYSLPEPAEIDRAEWTAVSPEAGDASGEAQREGNGPSSRGGRSATGGDKVEIQLHDVQPEDSAARIAEGYLADGAAVAAANLLDSNGALTIGQQLIVPGGRMLAPAVGAGRDALLDGAGRAAPAPTMPPRTAGLPQADRETGTDETSRQSGSRRSGAGMAVTTTQVSTAVDANPAHWAFIQGAIEPAQDSQRETGVPASVTIAQAIHESAWGGSRLSREGNNYFGIKATSGPGPRGVINARTWEHLDGENVTVTDAFRAYNNMAESFIDHGRFLLENKRYAGAMAKIDDARAFIRLVAQAGYATDPNYVRKVLAYMDRYNLYQYDLDRSAE